MVALLFAVFTTLRGVVWNNLWWLVTVTVGAASLGLALAALADRSRGRAAVRTLLLLPLAISMVSASVIWTYVYGGPGAGQAARGAERGARLVRAPARSTSSTDRMSCPWNNVFLMVVMIWIETGFAMVVLSAAIDAIPADVVEAARVDGARSSQVFWRITLPQIVPALLVVIATLVVTAGRVFDLVKVGTGGQLGTDVLANRMYENLRNGALTTSSTFGVLVLVLALPVLWFALRRTKAALR